MNIVIRHGAAIDATPLAGLAARTFQETFAADNRPEDMALHLASAYGTSQQQEELLDPDITTLLAEVDGELAGYAQLRSGEVPECVAGESPIELWRFYVVQSWHGRGVAQALMRRVELEASRRGGRTLWLGVWERNDRAKAFYSKNGFVDVGSHLFMVGTDAQTDRILARPLSRRNLVSISPFFIVKDLQASIAFYRDRLGFQLDFQGPEGDVYYAGVSRDGIGIMLKAILPDVLPCPNHTRHKWARWDAYVHTLDPDTLFHEFRERGVSFGKELSFIDDGLWGFEIADADGYVLAFFRLRNG